MPAQTLDLPIVSLTGIADATGAKHYVVRYWLNKKNIRPIGKVGAANVYDRSALDLARREITPAHGGAITHE